MKSVLLRGVCGSLIVCGSTMLSAGLLLAGTQEAEFNVNSRYTVEAVIISGDGWKTDLVADQNGKIEKISSALRRDMSALIGQKLNPAMLDGLAERLKKEFSAREVTQHLIRGDNPENVRVEFKIKPSRTKLDGTLTKFAYDSKQGWSGGGEAAVTVRQNTLAFGLVSDGDTLAERYSGIAARYENESLDTDRVSFRFQFASYHEQWNSTTLAAAAQSPQEASALYRARQEFEPKATILLAKPLTLEVGVDFDRFQEQIPAATTDSADAVFTTLRYHAAPEDFGFQQQLDADYELRAATRVLGSDFVFVSHSWNLRYRFSHGKHVLTDWLSGGVIDGRAPLADRFSLGDSTTLRGWNKYEIDPFGGNRMMHNSVEYRYSLIKIFYDTGAIWDVGQPAVPRHSLGVGLQEKALSLAVAFPLRDGRMEPVLIMGMTY
jgi:Omp85 superfamily domain